MSSLDHGIEDRTCKSWMSGMIYIYVNVMPFDGHDTM